MEKGIRLTIEELAGQVGVPVRTVRYYISEGLLPRPAGRGQATTYGEEHLLRLRLIRLLVGQRVPLDEIRQRLAPLSLEEVRALLEEETQRAAEKERTEELSPREYIAMLLRRARLREEETPAEEPEPPASDAFSPTPEVSYLRREPEPRRSLPEPERWHRWELAPGVELLVRSDSFYRFEWLIEQLLRVARQAFGYRGHWE